MISKDKANLFLGKNVRLETMQGAEKFGILKEVDDNEIVITFKGSPQVYDLMSLASIREAFNARA